MTTYPHDATTAECSCGYGIDTTDPEHPDYVADLEDRVDANREGRW